MFSNAWLLFFSLLAPVFAGPFDAYTEICYTYYTTHRPASTITTTDTEIPTVTVFHKVLVTPTTTVTPPATTITDIQVSFETDTTTLPPITDTFSSISTLYSDTTTTETLTLLYFSTEIDSIIADTSTVIVATSAGFTPIASANPGAAKLKPRDDIPFGGPPQPKDNGGQSSSIIDDVAATTAQYDFVNRFAFTSQYAYSIGCTDYSTYTTTSSLVGTAPTTNTVSSRTPIVYETTTITYTSWSSVLPEDASVTITEYTTSVHTYTWVYIDSSTLSTVTTTTTIIPPAATIYDACAADNIISGVNGDFIAGGGFSKGVLLSTSTGTSLDCCELCQDISDCAGTVWSFLGSCTLVSDGGVCDGSAIYGYFYTEPSGFNEYSLSNGQCGQQRYEG